MSCIVIYNEIRKLLIMKGFDITIYQLAILWFSGSVIVLLGALLRGGGGSFYHICT